MAKTEVLKIDSEIVKELHKQSIEDLGMYFANLLKSRRTFISMKYVLGESLELEFDVSRLNYGDE